MQSTVYVHCTYSFVHKLPQVHTGSTIVKTARNIIDDLCMNPFHIYVLPVMEIQNCAHMLVSCTHLKASTGG